jgi:hypothetical protein
MDPFLQHQAPAFGTALQSTRRGVSVSSLSVQYGGGHYRCVPSVPLDGMLCPYPDKRRMSRDVPDYHIFP